MAIEPLRRRRRTALLRGWTLLPGLLRLAGLRLASTLLRPVAALCVLAAACCRGCSHSMNNAIVLPLPIGWTWQVPCFLVASRAGVMLVAALVSSRRGTWDPVGLGLVSAEPLAALTAQEHRDRAVP